MVSGQGVEERYSEWLKQTPVQDFFEVSAYSNGLLHLVVKSEFDNPDNLKRLSLAWDSLSSAYEKVGIDVHALLMMALHKHTGKTLMELSIQLNSSVPNIFSALIAVSTEQGLSGIKIITQKNYLLVKGSEKGLVADRKRLFIPNDFVILTHDQETSQRLFYKTLVQLFNKKYQVSGQDISEEPLGTKGSIYRIIKKNLFAERYHFKIEVEVWFIPGDGGVTEVNFSFKGYYAQGILEPGAYIQIEQDVLPQLVELQNEFKTMIYLANSK